MHATPPTPVIAQREAAPTCWEPLQCVSFHGGHTQPVEQFNVLLRTRATGALQTEIRCLRTQSHRDRVMWKSTADTAMSGLARLPKDL